MVNSPPTRAAAPRARNLKTQAHVRRTIIWQIALPLGLAFMGAVVLGVLAVVYLLGLALGAVGQGRGSVPAFGTVARAFGWANLALASFTYLVITFRLLGHDYSAWQYGAFALILLAQLIAAGGLHVVSPARAVAIFAFPLLATVLFHLALVVYQVVFRSEPFSLYLVGDLALLLAMALVGTALLGENALRAFVERVIERIG